MHCDLKNRKRTSTQVAHDLIVLCNGTVFDEHDDFIVDVMNGSI